MIAAVRQFAILLTIESTESLNNRVALNNGVANTTYSTMLMYFWNCSNFEEPTSVMATDRLCSRSFGFEYDPTLIDPYAFRLSSQEYFVEWSQCSSFHHFTDLSPLLISRTTSKVITLLSLRQTSIKRTQRSLPLIRACLGWIDTHINIQNDYGKWHAPICTHINRRSEDMHWHRFREKMLDLSMIPH